MPGKDSVLALIQKLAPERDREQARMSLVENTNAAVAAQLSREPLEGPWLQVLLGNRPDQPPATILKQPTKPLAVLVGNLLLVSQTAPRCIRMELLREARARVLDYEQVYDRQLTCFYEAVAPALEAQCASASGGVSRK